MKRSISVVSLAILLAFLAAACEVPVETSLPTSTAATAETPTRIRPAYTFRPTITDWPTLTPLPFYTATTTPTLTPTPTKVPPGVFALAWYAPLIMHYDVTQWIDESSYGEPGQLFGRILQSTQLSSCWISEQGPTDFNGPHENLEVTIGAIDYLIILFPEEAGHNSFAFYMVAYKSVAGYDYYFGTPLLGVSALPDQWSKCRSLAEEVLATLAMP